MDYKEGMVYKTLEKIITSAGVQIIYDEVPDDSIDGAIWARSDYDSNQIMMPNDGEAFPDEITACCILGHEMGHIITGLDSTDIPDERMFNEAECDKIGVYLYRLAKMTADYEYEKKMEAAFAEAKRKQNPNLDGAPTFKSCTTPDPHSRKIEVSATTVEQKPGYIIVSETIKEQKPEYIIVSQTQNDDEKTKE